MASATRTYRSALRERQAEQTRDRIIAAAARTFSAQGYQATTLAAIAREAGVSVETVKAAGPKAELLIAAFEVTFSGAEGVKSFPETPVGVGLIELPDDVFVAAVVERIAEANKRSFALWTVLVGASLSDRTVEAALQLMLERRRDSFLEFSAQLGRRGIVSADTDTTALADVLSFHFSPEGFQQLVAQSGWSMQRYAAWLSAAARAGVAG